MEGIRSGNTRIKVATRCGKDSSSQLELDFTNALMHEESRTRLVFCVDKFLCMSQNMVHLSSNGNWQ
jgi:hypothetical protein